MAEEHLDDFAVDTPKAPVAAPPAPRYRRSRTGRNILIVAIALVVILAGLFLWRYLGSYESTDDAQVDAHLYPVSARVSGYVVKVNVEDNQYVRQGAVLVEIDPKDYEVAVEQAKAALASAEATAQSLNLDVPIASVNASSQLKFAASGVDDAGAGIVAAEKQLAAAQAQLEAAEANDVKAQDDLRRYKALVDKQEVAAQLYDQAVAAARASTATVTSPQPSSLCSARAADSGNPKRPGPPPKRARSRFL
jgi:membrane fusion protein (multidrug efflux system)